MKIEISEKKVSEIQADCEFILAVDKKLKHKWIKDESHLKTLGFKGNSDEVVILPHVNRVYIGVDSLDRDDIRVALSNAIKKIKDTSYKSIKIGAYIKDCPFTNIKAIVEGIILGNYSFDKYKTKNKDNKKIKRTLTISLEEYEDKNLNLAPAQKALLDAKIIADATNYSRDIVNSVPDDMTPKNLAKEAKKIADADENIDCFIGKEDFLEEQKMGAFLAVSRASKHKPRFIHLTYKPKETNGKKIVFVGKGLTYDSGGLSLKPSSSMVSMKSDKSGSAATLGIIKGASELKVPFEIHVIIGACENMIGGNAYKPDDILIAKNGKSIEVQNTDAEGRLVLADCLCYACDLKPDYLFDLATLTGACVVAVGEYTTGIMGHSRDLKHSFSKSAANSGELTATLPFNKYLKKLLKSKIADISNISSSRYGGAITAGLFLDNFVTKECKDKWLHLDIAGPAYVDSSWGYNPAGASGAGVRMALYWLKDQESKLNSHHKKAK